MSSILDVEELLRRAAEQVKRVIDYQILSIMLYDEEQKIFRHRLDVKHGQRVQGKMRVAASEGIVGAAATLREPVLGAGRDTGPAIFAGESGDAVGAGDSDAAQGTNSGVLDLESPQLNAFYAGPRADAIDSCGEYGGCRSKTPAFMNKWRETKRGSSGICRRRSAFRCVDSPRTNGRLWLDIAARYISAREVCGDLYEFLRYGPQQLGIALADVSGKGTAAALYGAVAIGNYAEPCAAEITTVGDVAADEPDRR